MASYKFVYSDDYLSHYGIKGQKWGVRRFQNEDGSLTEAGQKRYNKRKEYIDDLVKGQKEYYKRAKSNKKYYKKELEQLNNGGINSEYFRNQLQKYTDYGDKTFYYNSLEADGDGDLYENEEEAFDGLKKYYESEISRNTVTKEEVKKFNDMIERYESFPITERTFIENMDRGKKAFAATYVGLEAIEIATIVATNQYFLGAMSILPRQLLNFSASTKAENAAQNLGVKKEYRK